MNRAFESFDLSGFDLVVSSSHSCAKNVLTPPETEHVCYCHTPMRYAWEPRFLDQEDLGWASRTALSLLLDRIRAQDLAGAVRPDVFVANSDHVAARIAKYYRRSARVIHPPVDVAPLLAEPRHDRGYYLVLGRIVPYKRVDVAVAACERLGPVAQGRGNGAGPRRRPRARRAAHRVPRPCSGCRVAGAPGGGTGAAVPRYEDFGIVPVEAQAAGAPVVAHHAGGARESVVDGATGLLYADPSVEGLCAAIEIFESMSLDEQAIRANARRFTPERFRDEFAALIDELSPADR